MDTGIKQKYQFRWLHYTKRLTSVTLEHARLIPPLITGLSVVNPPAIISVEQVLEGSVESIRNLHKLLEIAVLDVGALRDKEISIIHLPNLHRLHFRSISAHPLPKMFEAFITPSLDTLHVATSIPGRGRNSMS